MKITTKYFGELDIEDMGIITFQEGIPGFDNLKKFVILKEADIPVEWLQSIEEDVAIPLIDPFSVKEEYEFEIPEEVEKELDVKSADDLLIRTALVIPDNPKESRTNLQGPFIMNLESGMGKQLILDDKYPIRYMIYEG